MSVMDESVLAGEQCADNIASLATHGCTGQEEGADDQE